MRNRDIILSHRFNFSGTVLIKILLNKLIIRGMFKNARFTQSYFKHWMLQRYHSMKIYSHCFNGIFHLNIITFKMLLIKTERTYLRIRNVPLILLKKGLLIQRQCRFPLPITQRTFCLFYNPSLLTWTLASSSSSS